MKWIRDMAADWVSDLGGATLFAWESLGTGIRRGVRVGSLIDQMYQVGVKSLPTTLTAGGFVGAILAIQLNAQLRDYGAQAVLGGLATSTTIRNIGPVLIAFMLSGKVGAYTAAELGSMRVTEQMDAVRCLGANPIEFIVVPRMLAVILSSFCLLVIGLMVGIAGGIVISHLVLSINAVEYVHKIPRYVSLWSVGTGMVKSLVFGIVIGVICCYRGYTASGGAAGVGRAVRQAAVEILVLIIVLDFTLSSLSEFLYSFLRVGLL
ncbi:MAG: ABC transporter permease [Bdellovibrionales bacterium]|nr:ABC transporter permease [Bdellovibrionales bacterium]MCB0419252.1 ABC transporter permease [Bdellovibrionales bacterium]